MTHAADWQHQKDEQIAIGTARMVVLGQQLASARTNHERARVLALMEHVAGDVYGAICALNAYGKLPRRRVSGGYGGW